MPSKIGAFILVALLYSCEKKAIDDGGGVNDPAITAIDLIDASKGFHKIYRYFDTQKPAGEGIIALDMTTQGNNRLNLAFTISDPNFNANSTTKNISRCAVDYTNSAELQSLSTATYNWYLTYKQFCQFASFSNLLGFGTASPNGYASIQGDITEATGVVKDELSKCRISKSGHLTASPFYHSDGIDRGDIYGCINAGKYTSYWDQAGYQGEDPFDEGIFEPIHGSNEGVLIAFHNDSASAYTRVLSDSVKYKGTRTSSVNVAIKMAVIDNINRNTTIKNNENGNDFSFALHGTDGMNTQFYFWTFKYNYATKEITKVIDAGYFWANEVLAYDIDPEGNFYCIKTDRSIYKWTTSGLTKIVDNLIVAGTPTLLKIFNGKIFLAVVNKTNGRQMDIVVQN